MPHLRQEIQRLCRSRRDRPSCPAGGMAAIRPLKRCEITQIPPNLLRSEFLAPTGRLKVRCPLGSLHVQGQHPPSLLYPQARLGQVSGVKCHAAGQNGCRAIVPALIYRHTSANRHQKTQAEESSAATLAAPCPSAVIRSSHGTIRFSKVCTTLLACIIN